MLVHEHLHAHNALLDEGVPSVAVRIPRRAPRSAAFGIRLRAATDTTPPHRRHSVPICCGGPSVAVPIVDLYDGAADESAPPTPTAPVKAALLASPTKPPPVKAVEVESSPYRAPAAVAGGAVLTPALHGWDVHCTIRMEMGFAFAAIL